MYTSTALEKGSGKIKTLQLTYLPVAGGTEKAARATSIAYMAALLREFEPTISAEQSTARVFNNNGARCAMSWRTMAIKG